MARGKEINMAIVTVKLTGPYRKYSPVGLNGGPFDLILSEHSTMYELLKIISVPEDSPKMILVNGQPAKEQTLLRDGDRVSIFAPMAGG